MSELLGGDETLFSLWPEHFLTKPPQSGLEWPLKDQQLIPVPIVILDDGRVAYKNDNGQICLLDGLQGVGEGEDILLPLPAVDDPTAELPALSDATIKSMLTQAVLDPELSLAEAEMPQLSEKDLPPAPSPSPVEALMSFRCQFCSFSSADVHRLMSHLKTLHQQEQPDSPSEQSSDSVVEETEHATSKDESAAADDQENEDQEATFVYLCSECKEGFPSIDKCRDHMITDHCMVLIKAESEKEKEKENENEEELLTRSPPPLPPTPPAAPLTPPPPPAKKVTKPVRKQPRKKPKDYDPEFEAKPHKCTVSYCMYKFRTVTALESHTACHVTEHTQRFVCPHCTQVFLRWSQCSLHLWNEHQVDVDLYPCTICNEYKTTTRKKLESHKKIHSEERPYTCTECGKGFKQRPQLVNHTASVHNKNKAVGKKWYMAKKCELCLKIYADSKSLKKHMQAVHSKLKPYTCQICGHMSARKAMMQSHMRQHTGEKPYACPVCDFRTGDHNSLRRHVMRHTGTRPYLCPHCPYTAIQSSSYKSHLQGRHPGLGGSFTCPDCCFVTVSEQSFERHRSDHKHNIIPSGNEDVFPENLAAAELVYRSLGASPSRLHSSVMNSATSLDRMKQTITISIPSQESAVTDDEDTTPCYLTNDEIDRGGITIPAEPETPPTTLVCFD